jgi:tetratricopeptide (TPR) repeat protein
VPTLIFAGTNAWYLGHPDGALRYLDDAIAIARRRNSPFQSAAVAALGAGIHCYRGDFKRALEAGHEAVRLSTAAGFRQFIGIGKIHGAWARAHLGESGGAVEQIREGLEELNPQKAHVAWARHLAQLSEAQALAGAIDDALVTVEEALLTNPDVLLYRPDLLRLRGELRLKKGQAELAERDFREAIEIARGMNAKSFELRATTSLARLIDQQGDRETARTMLAETYNWFTEGFDTADLKDAKGLLDELGV